MLPATVEQSGGFFHSRSRWGWIMLDQRWPGFAVQTATSFSRVGGDLAAANQHLCHEETKSAGSQQVERESDVRVATFLMP